MGTVSARTSYIHIIHIYKKKSADRVVASKTKKKRKTKKNFAIAYKKKGKRKMKKHVHY